MKKILLSGMVVLGSLLSAQQFISFETNQGYTTGNVGGQNGWISAIFPSSITNPNHTSTSQTTNVVTTEQFVDGNQSLKIPKDPNIAQNTLIGVSYPLAAPLDATDFTISFDVRITEQHNNSSDHIMQAVNTAGSPIPQGFIIDFAYDGNIKALDLAGGTPSWATLDTWTVNTWYRVKVVGTASNIQYFINDTLAYTGGHLSTTPTILNRVDFLRDNYEGDGYIDRIAINNEAALSVKETVGNDTAIAIYPNPTTDMLHISSDEKVNGVAIFDMTGRRMNADLKENQVNVNHLEKGNYIITVSTKKGKVSKKFIKK